MAPPSILHKVIDEQFAYGDRCALKIDVQTGPGPQAYGNSYSKRQKAQWIDADNQAKRDRILEKARAKEIDSGGSQDYRFIDEHESFSSVNMNRFCLLFSRVIFKRVQCFRQGERPSATLIVRNPNQLRIQQSVIIKRRVVREDVRKRFYVHRPRSSDLKTVKK